MTSTAAAASTAREDETIHVELQVLTVKECFIYKVPPLKSASGHRYGSNSYRSGPASYILIYLELKSGVLTALSSRGVCRYSRRIRRYEVSAFKLSPLIDSISFLSASDCYLLVQRSNATYYGRRKPHSIWAKLHWYFKSLTANLMASTKQIPLHIHLEIKEGETLTNFVDGVVDSSRYYVVRIKVSCLLTHLIPD